MRNMRWGGVLLLLLCGLLLSACSKSPRPPDGRNEAQKQSLRRQARVDQRVQLYLTEQWG